MGREIQPALSQELQISQSHSEEIADDGVNVVITAFEPFGFDNNEKTACWESVKLIPNLGVNFKRPVNVYCYQLRNMYDFISSQIARCWQKHKPHLVVITGQYIDCQYNELILEEYATTNHVLVDQLRRLTKDNCCTRNGAAYLKTHLDLHLVAKGLHERNIGIRGTIRQNTFGFYLCDYAYYNSLHVDPQRTVCIRVSDKQELLPEDLGHGLSVCISELLTQLDEKNLL